MNKKIEMFGIEFDNISMNEAIQRIEILIEEKVPAFILTPNVDHIVKLQVDSEFKFIYGKASMIVADGAPIIWAARLLGMPLKEKISGSDLLPKVCEMAEKNGLRVFFMGGRPGAADSAKVIMEKLYPEIQIVGTDCPPFGFEKDKNANITICEKIKNVRPDILFVGLGAPKQEKWIYNNYSQIGVPVSIGIGVSLEFIAGMVKRAPVWMQRNGLEWLWRLMMEPRRLWKRYLIEDTKFFSILLKEKFSNSDRSRCCQKKR